MPSGREVTISSTRATDAVGPGEHLEQVARQRVEPVRVLDDDGDLARRRARQQQPTQQVLQRGLAQLALERRRQVAVGHRDAEHRARAAARGRRAPGRAADGGDDRVGVAARRRGPAGRSRSRARRCTSRLGGDRARLPRRHEHAVGDELADQLGHQTGLAGAGLRLDDHDLARGRPAASRAGRAAGQLGVAPDEGVGGARQRRGGAPAARARRARTGTGLAASLHRDLVGQLVPDEAVARRARRRPRAPAPTRRGPASSAGPPG